ncbi:MAG: PIN domain-containing protein [Bacteroidota bacterium]
MKKIIVDTNIIFSFLLNTKGSIGDLVFNAEDTFEFFSNEYMQYEIRKHWNKLKKISNLSENELQTAYDKLLTRITFINEELIPEKIWLQSEITVARIDPDDIDFVALTKYLKGILWTGDKRLYKKLKEQRFRTVCNTDDLLRLRKRITGK